jgi:hypothetical protein
VWRQPRKDTGRGSVDPWLTPEYRQAHPGLGRSELALAWLVETFGAVVVR